MLKLITLSGSGATGKTSLANRFVEMQTANGHTAVVHQSVVRDFYAAHNVANEAAFLAMLPETRVVFQVKLMRHYVHMLRKRVDEESIRGTEFIICDRSLVDHFAYALYGSREMVDKELMNTMRGMLERYYEMMPNIYYLPYPAPWNNDEASKDGFRAVEPAKDTIIDAVIFKEVIRAPNYACIGTLEHYHSVEQRVLRIIDNLGHLHQVRLESSHGDG